MAPCTKQRCCDFVACRDMSFCGCCLPKSTGDARRLMWVGGFLALLAIVFILIALFVPATINNAFVRTLEASCVLTPSGTSFDLFANNEKFPMKLEVYLYNVTNPEEAVAGAKPALAEIGPFVYWVYRTIGPNYKFNDDNTLLSWKYYERYIFDSTLSIGDDEEVHLYQSNLPFWGVISNLISTGQYPMTDYFLKNLQQPGKAYEKDVNMAFAYRPVKELLFGYNDDPLFAFIKTMMPTFDSNYGGIMTNYTSVEDMETRLLFDDQITTGSDDRANARHYVQYRGSPTILSLQRKGCPWSKDETDDHCLVRGIDGAATVPINSKLPKKDLAFDFFFPSMFRHINFVNTMDYTEEYVDLYRFRFNDDEWKSGAEVPYNESYGIEIPGVFPLKLPLDGSPLSNTRPRQIGISSTEWKETVDLTFINDGKETEKGKDNYPMDTYFDLERQTGATLRFQSTSELVVTLGKIDYEYDDEMVILSDTDHDNNELSTLSEEDQQLKQNLQKMFSELNSFRSTGQFSEDNVDLSIVDSNEDASSSGSCSFYTLSPNNNNPSCMQSFQKVNQVLQQSRQSRQSRQFSTLQQSNDIVHSVYLPNLPTAHAPMFWANQTGGISQADLRTLGSAFKAVDETVKILPFACFIVALLLLLLAAFFLIRGSKFQHQIRKDLHTFEETPQDGDIKDSEGRHLTGEGQNYHDTLDALDLDPIYSNDYNHRHTAASSANIHGNVRNSQSIHRSVSTVSTTNKKIPRVGSLEQINTSGTPNYGGVELKNHL